MRKAVLNKQGPPGPPPRPGLQWKPESHRWIRPQESGSSQIHREEATEFLSQISSDWFRGRIESGEITNAKELAGYLDSQVHEEISHIRNDDDIDFEEMFGFDDTSENLDAFFQAVEEESHREAESAINAWKPTVDDLMQVWGDDIDEEMEGRGDPEAWIDERVKAIQATGSTEDPKVLRSNIEDQFNTHLVDRDIDNEFEDFKDNIKIYKL